MKIQIISILFILPCITVWAQDTPKKGGVVADSNTVRRLDEVVVSASRRPEKMLQSPVAVVRADAGLFRSSGAPSFFDALQNLKGVQMITPSMGFRVINTRGFSNTTNVRFSQLVDGLDIQSPHIGAPVANALGPSDLDIDHVEIVPGPASALYGMNTINGMADIFTLDPVNSAGISIQQKTGVNRINSSSGSAKLYSETSVRLAQVLSSKLSFKINGTFARGTDWIADDKTDLNAQINSTTGLFAADNPGQDAVSGYGNESSNRRTLSLQGKSYVVTRTGYAEKDVVDYGLKNFKADIAVYYRPTSTATLKFSYRMADFNNVYQRANRFSLLNYRLQQYGLSLSTPSIQFRAYANTEDTGDSYNLRSMAENIDKSYKSDDRWYADYTANFNKALSLGESVAQAHRSSRTAADQGRPQPGTPAFEQSLETLQQINDWDRGAALKVKATLLHSEVLIDLTRNYLSGIKKSLGVDLSLGADYRGYIIQPDGNYFINPDASMAGANLLYGRSGGFLSAARSILSDKLKLGAVLRVDKNDYFRARANLRLSAVYFPDSDQSIRLSYQDGYRYPSIFEAFSNVNSGGVKRIGGLRVMSNGIFESGWLKSSIDAFQAAVTRDVNISGLSRNAAIERNRNLLKKSSYTYLDPEHVRTLEAGYKALFADRRLVVDIDLYYNKYSLFIAQVEMSTPGTTMPDSIPYYLVDKAKQSRYRMWTNSATTVHNFGSDVKISYDFSNGILLEGNVSYAKLKKQPNGDGLEDGFNTPAWTVNAALNKENIFRRFGAGINYRWQQQFYWQSFLVNGTVPANITLDAQVHYSFADMPVGIKLGATNLLNHYYSSFLGGPSIGGFYYTTLSYGLNHPKKTNRPQNSKG